MGILFDFSEKFGVGQINKFRNFINSNNHFVLSKYKNIDEKNKWSIICSCMDWITVAVDYINSIEIKSKNDNIMSMQIYSMISSYDIIVDSVIQLSRVFFNKRESPFQNDRTIFDEKLTDEKYFKHIRAVFGAHPINLDDIFGNDKNKKYYASWATTRTLSNHDMHVFLYSNDPEERAVEFGIDFLKIHRFALKYYKYLDDIIEEIQKQYKECLSKKKDQIIEKKKDMLSQIKVLKIENQQRFDNDYYCYYLDELDMMFSAVCTYEKNEQAFNEYLMLLEKVVEEIHINLQNMRVCELKTANIINPRRPLKKHYDYEKVFNYLYGNNDYYSLYMFPHHFERIKEDLSSIAMFDVNLSKNELLLIINAGLYFTDRNNRRNGSEEK
jgi:hypothetical protein